MRWASTGAGPTRGRGRCGTRRRRPTRRRPSWPAGSRARRAPEADHAQLLRHVADRDGRIAVARMMLQPAAVGVDRAGAGDDAEAILGQPRHRDVGEDAAAGVEHLRVDDCADRPVDAVAAGALQQREGAGALDRRLAERRHVDDAGPLAERRVLGAEPVEVRRRRPAERALVGAGPAPRLTGLEVVGALPAVLRPEHRALLLQPPVQRRRALRPPPLVGVERVPQAVVVAVRLAGGRGGEVDVAVGVAEAPGAIGGDVDLGLARRDPLGHRLADAARAAEAVQRQPGRHPEAGHAGHGAEQRVRVGRHRVGVADEPGDAGVGEEREPPHGAGHQRREALLVGRQGAAAVLPRRAVLPARRRVRLVAAEQHATRLGLAVDEVVGVAEARHVARQLVPGHRLQRDVLVVDRNRRA